MSYSNTVTKEDLKNVLNEVLPTPRYGGVQTASWTADSSNANNVKLTDSIHLTTGTYVITVKFPYTSATLATAIHYGTGTLLDSFCISQGIAMSSHSYVINIPFEMDIYVASATSSSITYAYKERGGLRAIQISESSVSDNEADYIVEQGTSNGWTYRKWNSGVAELWCNTSGAIPTGWSQSGITINLPFTLLTVGMSQVQFRNYQVGRAYTSIPSTNASSVNIQTQADSAVAGSFSINIKGTWK